MCQHSAILLDTKSLETTEKKNQLLIYILTKIIGKWQFKVSSAIATKNIKYQITNLKKYVRHQYWKILCEIEVH